jgi:hypothetical protein
MPDTIERELADLERRYWQALKDKDVVAAVELTDEPCIVGRAGHRADRSCWLRPHDGVRHVDDPRLHDRRGRACAGG